MLSKKLGKACLNAMMRRVMESGERARGAQELLKLERFDEAMDIAYDIEPLLYEANHSCRAPAFFGMPIENPRTTKPSRPDPPSADA